MPQEQADEAAQASRLGSHAEASSSAKPKTKAQEHREQQIQKWLLSRAPRKEQSQNQAYPSQQPSEGRSSNLVSPKHRLLNSHNYPCTCIVFSPNGELLATASRDVRIYDVRTGEIKVILDGHGGLVRSIAFTPDGRLLCSGSDDCAALVWSLEHCFALCTPGKIVTLTPPGGPSSSNMPTNEQKAMATLTSNTPQEAAMRENSTTTTTTTSHSFSPMARVVQRVLRRHHKPVLAIATTPDSKYLVTGSADKTVRVWDVCTGYIMATLRGHTGEVSTVAVTPNGRRIVSSGADKVIFVWDFVTGECKRALKGHKGAVSSMAVAPDGHFLVTGSHDKTVRVWDLMNGNELATLSAHSGAFGVLSCAVSSDGTTIMSGGYDNLVKLWDAGSGLALATIQGHRHMVSSVAFSKDCTHLATAGRDDEVRIWNWQQPQVAAEATKSSVAVSEGAGTAGGGGGVAAASKQVSERLRASEIEDARNNRHWAYLFGDNSGKEDEGLGVKPQPFAPSRMGSVARGV
ncbi:hypothetical protein PLESTB_000711400 [Pleodorina starrii]|uniref:Uncharacterized protein n=1 Tax=Pleodorina starrii TaxID=330485 RepID=A0A9W6F2E9_9CHLO|nr:hypothetical protein PLESTM_000781700 [Pleodorina starrii]GLC48068.1 hypothetical protein PLESTB_000055600 [Pleodorina starrii]GLC53131.1 hypothetical protein PLESTB_000711400 [Pleodorina starrii]GLC68071.1 hypothetical protein PLESTF_000642900 [Pleodorina starrii]